MRSAVAGILLGALLFDQATTAALALQAPASSRLGGDPEAVRLAESLVEAIGGAGLWSRAQGLCVVERAYRPDQPEGEIAVFHRDLAAPRLRVDRVRRRPERDYVVGSTGGWRAEASAMVPLDPQLLASYRRRWPANIYVLYHRLAAADPRLTVRSEAERSFTVHEASRPIATFLLDAGGHVIRWTGPDVPGERREDWIYGPARRFGAVSFPAWGTRADGSYRFDYLRVAPQRQAFAEAVFTPSGPSRSC